MFPPSINRCPPLLPWLQVNERKKESEEGSKREKKVEGEGGVGAWVEVGCEQLGAQAAYNVSQFIRVWISGFSIMDFEKDSWLIVLFFPLSLLPSA